VWSVVRTDVTECHCQSLTAQCDMAVSSAERGSVM